MERTGVDFGGIQDMTRPGLVYREVYTLIEQFRNKADLWGRVRAASALADLGDPRGVSALIEGLGDDEPEVRKSAAKALARLPSVRAVDALIERMMDRNECLIIRMFAAESLRKTKGFRAMAALAAYQSEMNAGTLRASEENCPVRKRV
jgi:HEAT repeat protein